MTTVHKAENCFRIVLVSLYKPKKLKLKVNTVGKKKNRNDIENLAVKSSQNE